MIKNTPAIVAGISAGAVGLTSVFLWGLSMSVGHNVAAFVSIQDYAQLSFQWLTPVVVGGLVWSLGSEVLGKYWWVPEMLLILAFLIFSLWDLNDESSVGTDTGMIVLAAGSLICLLLSILSIYYMNKDDREKSFVGFRLALFVLVVFAFSRGFSVGSSLLEAQEANTSVQIERQEQPVLGRRVLILNRYILLLEGKENNLVALPMEKTVRFELL